MDTYKGSMFSDPYNYGISAGCSLWIGLVEFKNGKCYYGMSLGSSGPTISAEYYIEDGLGYVKNNAASNVSTKLFEIVDENTILFNNCELKKLYLTDFDLYHAITKTNLREGPGMDFEVLKTLEKGDRVLILEETSDWVKVNAFYKEGYVHKEYLTIEK